MVVIRLTRGGTNKRPFYHIVIADQRAARNGRYIEKVGYFNPIAKGAEIRLHLEKEKIANWISKGAQPSSRVAKLLIEHEKPEVLEKRKVLNAKKKAAKTHKKAKTKKAAVVAETPAADTEATTAA